MTTQVNQYGWKALISSAVGYAMDGFDLLILGFMLTAISADLHLTSTQPVLWSLGRLSAPLPVGLYLAH